MEIFDKFIVLIKEVGYPMALSIYLLVRIDPLLRGIRDELRYLNGRKST